MNNHFVSRVFKYEKLAKLQNTRPLWSASLTCVGRLWRPRHNTIYAILIQWHVNEWPGILQLLREIFHWVSKVNQDCVSFTLLCSVIGPETYATLKLKPITSWSPAFSRALFSLFVFTLSSHWLLIVFSFLLIGRCDYFGFGFTTLN